MRAEGKPAALLLLGLALTLLALALPAPDGATSSAEASSAGAASAQHAAGKRACAAPPAQSITKRRNISCKRARKVYLKYGDSRLECRGDGPSFAGGWKFVGVARRGEIIDAKASKNSKSFHYGGGGTC